MRKERMSMISGGMAGFISIAFIQLTTTQFEKLDSSQIVALYCFAFSLPMTVFYFVSAQMYLKIERTKAPYLYELMASVTILVGFIGIAASFYHFTPILAYIFGGTSFIAVIVFNSFESRREVLFQSESQNDYETIPSNTNNSSLLKIEKPKSTPKNKKIKSSKRKKL